MHCLIDLGRCARCVLRYIDRLFPSSHLLPGIATAMLQFFKIVAAALLLVRTTSAIPANIFRRADETPVIDANFPDPAIYLDDDGTYYAYATNSGGINVQVATASAVAGPWTVLSAHDALPTIPAWSSGAVWAPDVSRAADGTYVLYFAATDSASTAQRKSDCSVAGALVLFAKYVIARLCWRCNWYSSRRAVHSCFHRARMSDFRGRSNRSRRIC